MTDDEIKAGLMNHPLFDGLEQSDVDFLADCAVTREIDANASLFRYDDPADRFFILRSGQVAIEIAALEGPPLELQRLQPGEVLGWSWLIPPFRWSFQARLGADVTAARAREDAHDGGMAPERLRLVADVQPALAQHVVHVRVAPGETAVEFHRLHAATR